MHIIAATLLIAAVSSSPSKDARILAELDRLEAMLQKVEPSTPKEFGDIIKMTRDSFDKVRKAKTPETRLYRLRFPYVEIEMLTYLNEHQSAGKDLDTFTKFWNERKSRFAAAPAPRGTLIEKAVQEAAINRAQKVFIAALPYAKADGPSSGPYYVAEAEGNRRYADFVRSIASDADAKSPLNSATLQKALDSLHGDVIQLFETDPTGRGMLPVSAKLKETGELLDAKKLEAATLSLLESRYELSKRAPKPDAAPSTVAAPKDPIGALWDEIASIEVPDNTRAIRNDVIPLYASMLAHPVVPTAQATTKAPVTVTLIRWPYT